MKKLMDLVGAFGCFLDGRFMEVGDFMEAVDGELMDDAFCSFLMREQERVDRGLKVLYIDQCFYKLLKEFIKKDAARFSGMDIDKGYYNKLDDIHLWAVGWIQYYETLFPCEASQELPKPQPIADSMQLAKRGRPCCNDIQSCINGDEAQKEKVLNALHRVIDGEKGKITALAVLVCVERGIMSKPTFPAIEKEFGNVGSHTGFGRYMRGGFDCYEKAEISGMKERLKDILK